MLLGDAKTTCAGAAPMATSSGSALSKRIPLNVTRAPSTAQAGLAVAMLVRRTWPYLSRLVELDVPVQIVPPAVGRVADPDLDGHGRRIRPLGMTKQAHAGFCGSPAALAAVARDAA